MNIAFVWHLQVLLTNVSNENDKEFLHLQFNAGISIMGGQVHLTDPQNHPRLVPSQRLGSLARFQVTSLRISILRILKQSKIRYPVPKTRKAINENKQESARSHLIARPLILKYYKILSSSISSFKPIRVMTAVMTLLNIHL